MRWVIAISNDAQQNKVAMAENKIDRNNLTFNRNRNRVDPELPNVF